MLIDENLPDVSAALHDAFRQDRFLHVTRAGLSGTNDVELFQLATGDYDLIVTRDRMKLQRPAELEALRRSGMSWLGCSVIHATDFPNIPLTTAQLVLGIAHVLRDIVAGLGPPPARLATRLPLFP